MCVSVCHLVFVPRICTPRGMRWNLQSLNYCGAENLILVNSGYAIAVTEVAKIKNLTDLLFFSLTLLYLCDDDIATRECR